MDSSPSNAPISSGPVLKETFHVAGDRPDPAGTGLRGATMGYDLTRATRHVLVQYLTPKAELLLELDVYVVPDAPVKVVLLCPRCLARGREAGLSISGDQKAIDYRPDQPPPPFPHWSPAQVRHAYPEGVGGTISIETFACTWEEDPTARRGGGFERCGWKVSIDKNVARDRR